MVAQLLAIPGRLSLPPAHPPTPRVHPSAHQAAPTCAPRAGCQGWPGQVNRGGAGRRPPRAGCSRRRRQTAPWGPVKWRQWGGWGTGYEPWRGRPHSHPHPHVLLLATSRTRHCKHTPFRSSLEAAHVVAGGYHRSLAVRRMRHKHVSQHRRPGRQHLGVQWQAAAGHNGIAVG